jgi:hypothetical protein
MSTGERWAVCQLSAVHPSTAVLVRQDGRSAAHPTTLREALTMTAHADHSQDDTYIWQAAEAAADAAQLAADHAEAAADTAVKVAGATLAAGAAARQAALAYDAIRASLTALAALTESIRNAGTLGENVATGADWATLQSAGDRAKDRAMSASDAAINAREAAKTVRQCAAVTGPRW